MYPIRLQLEDFCGHSKSDISFEDFSSAIILGTIKGNYKFSNGVGKSTIFYAIKYVLFNEVDFSTLDKAIRNGTDQCKVILDFRSSDGEIYRIIRSKNKKVGSEILLYKKNKEEWENLTQRRNIDTEKELNKIIKINYKTFCNSALFAQADLSGLASLTPEKRKLALKEALQLNIYSKYELAAKKKREELLTEINKEKTILKTLGLPIGDINKFEKELEIIDSSLMDKSNLLVAVKEQYEKETELYTVSTKKFEALERQSAEYGLKQKILQDDIKKISEIVKDYNKKLTIVKNEGKSLSKEIEDLLSVLGAMISSKFRDKEVVRSEIDNTTKSIIDKKVQVNTKFSELTELKIPLPTGSTCKHCRQTLKFSSKEDRDACQSSIDEEILNKEKEISSLKNELSSLELFNKKLLEELKNIEYTESNIINKRSVISSKNKEVEVKRSLFAEYSDLLEKNEEILSEKNKEFDIIRKGQFINNAEEYIKFKNDLNNIKSRLLLLSSDLDETNKRIVELSNNKAVLLHRIEVRKKDGEKVIECLANINDLENKFVIHQKVIQAFGSTGIPALITHTILDDFQVETNYWLSRLRPGLQLQFSVVKDRDDGDKEDTLDINFIINGYDMEYAQLSGAQKLLVALSLKLGLASVIKKRLGVELGILLIDEVDQSLDEGGLEAFEEAIRQLQQDFKVLVITHNNELKLKFNYAILVEQDEKFVSTAKVVNTW